MTKKPRIPLALIPALSMWVALSACSGGSPDDTTSDLDDYCASVEDADEICADLERASEEPSNPSRATDQSSPSSPENQAAWTAVMF